MLDIQSTILIGSLASLAAGLATGVGASPILFFAPPGEERQRSLLGFAAGVMLAASFFSLILPGIEVLQEQGASTSASAATMAVAVLLGALAIAALNRFAPVDHLAAGPAGSEAGVVRRVWLFILAVTLHNFPEGMAVGVSFGGGDMQQGLATAIGIGLQNIPEGLAVAVSLATVGYSRGQCFAGGLASGLVEPLGGLFGVTLVYAVQAALPWGLGFSAGAMIYVVSAEIIPLCQPRQPARDCAPGREGEKPMLSLIVGLVGMMFLDISLG